MIAPSEVGDSNLMFPTLGIAFHGKFDSKIGGEVVERITIFIRNPGWASD